MNGAALACRTGGGGCGGAGGRAPYQRRPPNLRACELMPLAELRRWIRGLVRMCERILSDALAPRHLRMLAGRILARLPAARRAIAFGGRRTVTAEVASWRRQLAGRVREVRGWRSEVGI